MGGDVRISQAALTQEFFLAASLGLCRVSEVNVKFGYAPELVTTDLVTIWPGSKDTIAQNLYIYPDAAGETVEAVSGIAGDTTQSIQVEGLDENGAPQTEIIALNGTTVVPSVNTWLSVERAFVIGAAPVVGEILVQGDGVTSTNIFAIILPADQQTVQVAMMVPAGKVMVIVNYSTAINKGGNQDAFAIMKLIGERSGGVPRTAIRYGIQSAGVSNISSDLVIPALFPPLCKVYVTGEFTTTAGAGDISAEFSYILVGEDTIPAALLAAL